MSSLINRRATPSGSKFLRPDSIDAHVHNKMLTDVKVHKPTRHSYLKNRLINKVRGILPHRPSLFNWC